MQPRRLATSSSNLKRLKRCWSSSCWIAGLIGLLVVLGWQQMVWFPSTTFVLDTGIFSTGGFDERDPSPPARRPRSDASSSVATVGKEAKSDERRQSTTTVGTKKRRKKKSRPLAAAGPPMNSMAACLVVMDDNHWLIEWLAYHYHVMPLRSLIVVQDPHSKTSPLPVLERWKGKMNITVWKDERFVKPWILQNYRAGRMEQYRLHRFRQQFFYPACLKAFQAQRQDWVLLVDTDELVRPSPFFYNHSALVHPVETPGSVLSTLRDYERSYSGKSLPACLHIPRLQMSARRDGDTVPDGKKEGRHPPVADGVVTTTVPSPFNASHFLTASWFYHPGKAISTGHANLDGKNVVHVQRVSAGHIPSRVKTVHHVLPSVCPVKVETRDSPLVIHHYLGTLEQYTARTDPRDSIPNRPSRNAKLYHSYPGKVRDTALLPWLSGFVRDVGSEEARRLLEGVGVVERPPTG